MISRILLIWYLGCHPETHLSFAFTDLVFSTDDECKLPPHSREVNKYPKHKTYSKDRRNGTVVVNSVCKSVCIREDFLSTKKKEKPVSSCCADSNGAYIWKGSVKKIFNVTHLMKQNQRWLEQEFTKLIRVVLSLYVNERACQL